MFFSWKSQLEGVATSDKQVKKIQRYHDLTITQSTSMSSWNPSNSEINVQYCAKVMQTPVDEIRRNSWLFDEFLTETKLRRHFREFSRHVLFWTARTFGDKFLDGVNATRNFERKFVLCGEFSGRKFVVLFILLKKIWLNLWLVTTLCNTPIKFPATIPVSARPILFATMATQVVVSMRLGSFMYSTFDSNHGKSFKLF